MSSIRKVFWRGAFALALLPASFGLVAANASAPAEATPDWQRVAVAVAQAKQQQAGGHSVHVVLIVRERGAQPPG